MRECFHISVIVIFAIYRPCFSGPQLNRVTVLSSCASVSNPTDEGILNESNWNEDNIVEIKEKGKDASQAAKYRASKSLAEKCERL